MLQDLLNYFNRFAALVSTPEGLAAVISLVIFFGIIISVMCFYGIYAIRVFKRQIADEPRLIPVLATLYHVIGFIIGLLYIGFIMGIVFSMLPSMASGAMPDLNWLIDLIMMAVTSNPETFLTVYMIVMVVMVVWSWIAIFDSFYTVFCPGNVRDLYSGDMGDVLVRHRRWIVIPPLVLFGLYFILYIVIIVFAFSTIF